MLQPEPDASYEELLVRIARGDKDALKSLLKIESGFVEREVRSLLTRGTRRHLDTGDIASEVCIAALTSNSTPTFATKSAFRAWLAKITRNCFFNKHRYHKAARRRPGIHADTYDEVKDADITPIGPKPFTDAGTRATISEAHADLTAKIDSLDEQDKRILKAHLEERLSHREIAQELSTDAKPVTADAVRMRIKRVLAPLVGKWGP